jgi:hypothetical protein
MQHVANIYKIFKIITYSFYSQIWLNLLVKDC